MKTGILGDTGIENDLAVFIDEELKFHVRFSKAVKNASRLLGLIRATFTCPVTVTISELFTTTWSDHT